MDVRFCPICRDERLPNAQFCAGCGYRFSALVEAVASRYGGPAGAIAQAAPPPAGGLVPVLELSPEAAIERRGLRPFGNRRRLLVDGGGRGYVYVALFRDPRLAESYADAFLAAARRNPPPSLIELQVVFLPRIIHTEKFGVAFPYPDDALPEYARWVRETMIAANDTIRPANYFAGYAYPDVLPSAEAVIRWHVVAPATLPGDYDELMTDPEGLGYGAIPLAGEGRAVPEMPDPQGPWVEMLLRLDNFSEWASEPAIKPRNKTEALLEVLGDGRLGPCVVRGTRYDEQSFAVAIHTASATDADTIERNAMAARDRCRALQGILIFDRSLVRPDDLPFNGFLSEDGRYLGN